MNKGPSCWKSSINWLSTINAILIVLLFVGALESFQLSRLNLGFGLIGAALLGAVLGAFTLPLLVLVAAGAFVVGRKKRLV